MDSIIDSLIKHILKNKIKIVTITESNHRSYTSHTFHFKLIKALYENKIIDTFSSERMGINDGLMIDYYLKNKLDLENLHKSLSFGGMGYYRIIKYFDKKPYDSYKIVGLEGDRMCFKIADRSPTGFVPLEYKMPKDREKFWLKNIKKILEKRGNLFINGYHLSKDDLIGKYLKKHYGEKTLFISMGALEIKTQILLIDRNLYPIESDFNRAIVDNKYKLKVENIDKIAKPTPLEKKYQDWKLVKVDKKNKDLTFRAVGCYLALYKDEYEKGIDLTPEISYKLASYDYFVFFKKSVYKEEMFF